MKSNVPVFAWERNPPSKRDILEFSIIAMELMAEALPIAVRAVGALSPEQQLRFWWAFVDFERETDLDATGGYSPLTIDKWGEKLREWSIVARERINKPSGDLSISQPQAETGDHK